MATQNIPTLESTFKSADTEEFIDIHFYRPLGYKWALFFHKMGITPNQITIASIFIGIAAGICFYFNNLGINLVGIFLLVWANTYDSADGQLARMTNQKTAMGRILDGTCSVFWFISIYIALMGRIWPEWNFWILILAIVAGYSHAKQTAMADYYRNVHLLFLNGKKGSELDNSKDIKAKYELMNWEKQPFATFFEFFYLNYTKGQETWTPQLQRMMSVINEKYAGEPPNWFRKYYRKKSLPFIKYTNMLSFNLRAIILFISILTGYPWVYFVFEITVMNIMLIYMLKRYERICYKFRGGLELED